MMSLGPCSTAEQPHTALETIVGTPTFVTNAHAGGGADTRMCWWCRNLPAHEPPPDVAPAVFRRDELSAALDAGKQRTPDRSRTPRAFAEALVAAWFVPDSARGEADDLLKGAATLLPAYGAWRKATRHNYGLFAASYAPTLSAGETADDSRARAGADPHADRVVSRRRLLAPPVRRRRPRPRFWRAPRRTSASQAAGGSRGSGAVC